MKQFSSKELSAIVATLSVFASGFLIVQTIYGASVASTVTIQTSTPVVSSIFINGNNPSTITLTANATTTVNVNAVISDSNGCSELTGSTTTILLYRSGVTSSSCFTGSGAAVTSLNCYTATAFSASSTCSAGSQNTTTTFAVQYFAQATDASSSFPAQNWMATILYKATSNTTTSADTTSVSSTNDFATLTALNITTSSINYGLLAASSTTGSVNQNTTTTNAGNSSTSVQISAQATLTSGANSISTSSQAYATSSFTQAVGTTSTPLTGSGVTVPGVVLTSPTSTTNVSTLFLWGLTVPNATPTGTYNGTNLFTAVFSS